MNKNTDEQDNPRGADGELAQDKNGCGAETWTPLSLIEAIRAALGDGGGRLTEDQLVDRCRGMRGALERIRDCDWVITLPDRMDGVREIARGALEVPHARFNRGETS